MLDLDYNDPLVKPHQFIYESNNFVTLRLAESSTLSLPDVFTVRVNFKVIYKADNSGDVYYDSTSTFLEINYNKNSTYQHLSSMRIANVVSSTVRI